jgi:hypothetical protein
VASISQRACSAIALALSTLTLPYCLAQLRSPLVEPPAAARHVTGHHVECCIALTALAPGDAAACRQRRQCRRGWVRGSERAGQSSDGLTISLVRLLPLASLELKPPSAPCECTSAPALHGRLVALQVPCVPAPTSPSSSAASAIRHRLQVRRAGVLCQGNLLPLASSSLPPLVSRLVPAFISDFSFFFFLTEAFFSELQC